MVFGYGAIMRVPPSFGEDQLRRDVRGVLVCAMAHTDNLREAVEYRGYSLQVTYASPQWQVLTSMAVKDRPTIVPEDRSQSVE